MNALGVHRQDLVPLAFGQVLQPCDGDDAGVLDRDVDFTQFLRDALVERFHLLAAGASVSAEMA